LKVVDLVITAPTDRVFVVDLKVANAMGAAAVGAPSSLVSEEFILHFPGNDASPSTRIV
jgi:hypothetical protein